MCKRAAAIQGKRAHVCSFCISVTFPVPITSTCLVAARRRRFFAYSHIPPRDWRAKIGRTKRRKTGPNVIAAANCVLRAVSISPPHPHSVE